MSLTLADYAAAKQLDIAFLKSLGIAQHHDTDGPFLRIPYFDAAGEEALVRYRHEMSGPRRFRWRTGTKPDLYGLDRLTHAREKNYILIVEGESDCHTLWQADIPAIGLPGCNMWVELRDAPRFEGIDKIYLVREPGESGERMMTWLATSQIRARTFILDLGEHKDPSGLYLADPATFATRLQDALESAIPYPAIEAANNDEGARRALEQCRDLATTPDILAAFRESLQQLGAVGEDRNACVIYLALTSRLLRKPVSVVVKGPSSGGKSFIVDRVLDHMPAAAFLKFTGMSERALLYMEEDLIHRHLVFAEAAGAEAEMQAYILRTLLSEGVLTYPTVDKTADGMKGRNLVKEGPTGLIMTTTKIRVHEENETRLISLSANDTREQTRAVLRAIATRPAVRTIPPHWPALQSWLAYGERRVIVPYLPALAELVSWDAVRMRRDFDAVKSLVEAHALLHRASRTCTPDGAILATLADYAIVRDLIADLISEGHAATVRPTVQETVEIVGRLTSAGGAASLRDIASLLLLDIKTATRRCQDALKSGFLVNEETRPGRKARYVLGDPMPDGGPVLPTTHDVAAKQTELDRLAASAHAESETAREIAAIVKAYEALYGTGGEEKEETPDEVQARDERREGGDPLLPLEITCTTAPPPPNWCSGSPIPEGMKALPPPSPTSWTEEDRDHFEDMAARLEFDELLTREESERLARQAVEQTRKSRGEAA